MTEHIDLDAVETDDEPEREGTDGDWFWRDEDDAADPLDAAETVAVTPYEPEGDDPDADLDDPIPRVPRKHGDKPAGIPTEYGGAGAGATAGDGGGVTVGTGSRRSDSSDTGDRASPDGDAPVGDVDMTMALTYGAVKRLADPRAVLASARAWADFVGIVGDVSTPVITRFQREHGVDADFFNGTGTGPGERLADVDAESLFYADRMVVVGSPDDEWMAEQAGWEFVPLTEAAEKADWELTTTEQSE